MYWENAGIWITANHTHNWSVHNERLVQLSATMLQACFLKQSTFILQCFWPPQLCSLHVSGPHFLVSVGLWGWLITSFVPQGKRGMSRWLILTVCRWREEEIFFPFPLYIFLDSPQALFTHSFFSTMTNGLIFLKALGRSLGKWGVRAFFCLSRALAV